MVAVSSGLLIPCLVATLVGTSKWLSRLGLEISPNHKEGDKDKEKYDNDGWAPPNVTQDSANVWRKKPDDREPLPFVSTTMAA
jgi:hypothetical protein